MKYYTQRRGILTFTAGIVYGFVKTQADMEEPDVQFHFAHASYGNAQTRDLEREPGMTLTVYQCRPESKGSIHAKSSDPAAMPAIRPNYLADPMDRRVLVDGMKIGRRIINNAILDKYRAFEMNPGDKVQTDDEWLDFARRNGQTTYHVIGTCKMGSDPLRGGGRSAARARNCRTARGRCVDHADRAVGQHQRRGHHDRGKRRRHDQGRGERTVTRRGLTVVVPSSPGSTR